MSDMDALRAKYFEMMMEAAGQSLTAEQRKASATIIRTKADGTKEYKFPMPDEKHARLALSMINTSDLSRTEKEKVRNRAEKMIEAKGGKPMPPWMKDEEKDEEKKDSKSKKGYHKMPNGKMMKGEKHSEEMKEGGWDKPWSKEDESKMPADEKKKMMEAWSKMGDADKKMMMKEYGSYGPPMKKYMMEGYGMKKEPMKETGAMVPAGDAILPKKGGPQAKKDLMKEANGMVGSKADPNAPTNKKMMENWEGGGDMGQTGDPKKKPIKGKGKSWLAKGDTPVIPD